MAGIGNNAAAMGDWMPPSPTHRNFFSNLMVDEIDLKHFTNGNDGPSLKSKEEEEEEENVVDVKIEECGDGGVEFSTGFSSKPSSVNGHKPSFTERRAARAGFSAPKIDTEQIRSSNFASSSSEIRSPYVTIPPGLSPTTLLDSPVFLSNSMAQPSPTTGTFPFAQFGQTNTFSIAASLAPDKSKDHPLDGINPDTSDVKLSNPFSFSRGDQPVTTDPQNTKERNMSDALITNQSLFDPNPTTAKESSPPPDHSEEEETKGESSLALGAPAEDGYNWRKYGQKHVKGSEYPRSYYKCTHTNCPVKKKVERNHEGQVTEIVYKGAHNHPKPTPNHRSGVPSSHPFNDYQMDGHDWRNDSSFDATPLASSATEYCENQEAGEVSSTLSNEEDEDRATHGSISVGCDGEGEESESKRRKLDVCAVEMSTGSRAVREPRVVVQTTSEVDILDDGYRWRKYGQKVVKGNPNPRSYYKCTHPGCSVRKHVERASHDLKSVITTYEGKHTHEVPAARSGSGQTSSTPPTSTPPSVPQPSRRSQESFTRYDATSSPLPPFGAPPGGNFSFSVGPQGLAMSRFGPMTLPPINSYLGHQNPVEAGLVVPKGEPKESGSNMNMNMNMANGGASLYYHQLMSRMILD